jgi:hypothetical protein
MLYLAEKKKGSEQMLQICVRWHKAEIAVEGQWRCQASNEQKGSTLERTGS